MKRFLSLTLVLAVSSLHAQSVSSKKELVARILDIQRPAIEQTAQALVERPAIQLHQQAALALQTRVPPEKRESAAKLVQQDLKQYVDEMGPLVRAQAVKLAPSTIGALLEDKFTEDELKQLITIMESPVNRKFAQISTDFDKALGEKLVAQTQSTVAPKVKALEQNVTKHLGLPPPEAKKTDSPSKGSKK